MGHVSACALQLLRLPTFSYPPKRPMSVVAKRSPISATAEVLYKRLLKNQFGGRKVVGQAAVVRRLMGQKT